MSTIDSKRQCMEGLMMDVTEEISAHTETLNQVVGTHLIATVSSFIMEFMHIQDVTRQGHLAGMLSLFVVLAKVSFTPILFMEVKG